MLADAVEVTLGSGGRNVVMEAFSAFGITKDGVTVAREIDFGGRIWKRWRL